MPRYRPLLLSLTAVAFPLLVVVARPHPAAATVDVAAGLRRLPLRFEANQGQADPQVRYSARGRGYSVFLTDAGAVVSLRSARPATTVESVLRLQLLGARSRQPSEGEVHLPGVSHYFRGQEAAGWHSDVPQFGRVRYSEVYPGIDLVYYGHERRLEHDFVVAPGADPRRIRMAFAGAQAARITEEGDLVLTTAAGELRQERPEIYQERAGRRERVEGSYVLLSTEKTPAVAFDIGKYDASRPLIIDPVLSYGTLLGGSDWDEGRSAAVDPQGNVYVAGSTASPDFPTTPGVRQQRQYGSEIDVFVTKFSPAGELIYSTYLGGSGTDRAQGVAVDAQGSVYVTGMTGWSDFPTTPGAVQRNFDGGHPNSYSTDAFVTKLLPSGAGLVYSTFLGGSDSENYYLDGSIAVDDQGHAFVAGTTWSADFPTRNAVQAVPGGNGDAYVAELSPDGMELIYSTYVGGSYAEEGHGIALTAEGEATITGQTLSRDFPVLNAVQPYLAGSADAFVVRLQPSGGGYVFSTFLGGQSHDGAAGVAVDADGNSYVTGKTWSRDFPQAQPIANQRAFSSAAFVTKLGATGGSLAYSTYVGTGSSSGGEAIAVDGAGNAYVAGSTWDGTFPVAAPVQSARQGSADAFVFKLNPVGSGLIYATFLGGTDGQLPGCDEWTIDHAYGIAVDRAGSAWVTGVTDSPDFPGLTASVSGRSGLTDAFLVRISAGSQPPAAPRSPVIRTGMAGGVVFSWEPGAGTVTSFELQRQQGNGFFTRLGSVPAGVTEWNDATVTPNTQYTYRVRAENADGCSPFATAAKQTLPPSAPTELAITLTADTWLSLGWKSDNLAPVSFRVERSTDEGITFVPLAQTSAKFYTDPDLGGAASYRYRVSAVSPSGTSAYSNEVIAPPGRFAPAAASELGATVVDGGVRLAWRDGSTNESEFRIERRDGAGNFTQVGTVGANITQFLDGSGTASRTTVYRVRAANLNGVSAPSNEAQALGEGRLFVSTHSVQFGTVKGGAYHYRHVTLTNRGKGPVSGRVYSIMGGDFGVATGGFFLLAPGERRRIEVVFRPLHAGAQRDQFEIVSNDPRSASHTIRLTGRGKWTGRKF